MVGIDVYLTKVTAFALCVLAAMDVLPREDLAGFAALGELSLDGTLNPVAGNNQAFVASYTTLSWTGNLEARGTKIHWASNAQQARDIMFGILKEVAEDGEEIVGQGTIEVLADGFGFLRSPDANYLPGPDDIQ